MAMLIKTAKDQVQKTFLGTECEKEIYKAVRELQKVGHGLSRKEILQLAGEID